MLEQTFASLAILKVNADRQSKDYIQYFVPFVAEIIRLSDRDEVSLGEIQVRVLREFGLHLPLNALKTILNRAASDKYVTKDHGIYYRNNEAAFDLGILREREQFLRSYSSLIEKLIDFAEGRYQNRWSQEDAESGLFSYLEKNSGPLLAAAVKGVPIVSRTDLSTNLKDADYIINAFVEHLVKSDATGFDFLETVVKGRMLADVLLFDDLSVVKRPFNGVEIYFDTQFIMRSLGCSGESLRAPCIELIQLLRKHGALLRVFDHTYSETTGILERAAKSLRSFSNIGNKRGEALQYFINENLKPSDIEMIIDALPDHLDQLQIRPKAIPNYTLSLGVDEVKLRTVLQAEVRYKDPDSAMMDNDVASLTAIHRLRQGALQYRIESCEALFVTSNHSLVRASGRFFQEEYSFSKVPHCMLDFVLATLVWLKEPLQTSSELPHKRIIASCYAAMKPDEYLWSKYLDEADALRRSGRISENSLQLARSSQRILMDITKGDAMGFSEGTVLEVIDVAIQEIRQEEALKLQEKHDEETQSLLRKNDETVGQLSREEQLRQQFESQFREQNDLQQQKIERIRGLAKKYSHIFSWIVTGLLIFLLILELYLQHQEASISPHHGIRKFLITTVLGIGILLALAHNIFGLSVMEIGCKLEDWLARFFEKHLMKWKEL